MKLIPLSLPRFLPSTLRQPRGFTLIATLMILALMVVLLVGAFTNATTELSVARSHYNDYRATLALESAFQAATRKAFRQIERTEDFVVFRRQQAGAAAPHLRPVVYYTAVYDSAASLWRYQPLISGARTDVTTPTLVRQPGGAALKSSAISAGLTDATGFPIVAGTGATGWSDTPLTAAWETLDFRPAEVSGVDPAISPDLTANAQDKRSKGQELRVRYCYWIEDLAGRLDGDLAGNMEGANQTHLRGQPAAIKDQPRQLALFTLMPPTPGTPGVTFPNVDTAATSTLDNFLINRRQYLLTNETATQIGLNSAPVETMVKKALTFGLPQWEEREVIPSKTSIAAAKRGQAKLDINNLIRRAESDTSATGAGERDAAITQLAEHIKAALPQFALKRAGGNVDNSSLNTAYQGAPNGRLMTTDEYVYSLAANIIDYADRDQTPSVDPTWVRSTTTTGYGPGDINVPKYRGIDGQPFCVGYATRFLNTDWTNTSVTAQVSVWVALWNPTDREIEGDLQVRFTEGRTVLNCMLQGEDIEGGSRPVLPHLDLPTKHISLGPNEFMHVPWYDVHTMTATGLTAARVNNPLFRMMPDDIIGQHRKSWFDGGYQIIWNGKLADRTRRPDNINRPYRQQAGTTNDRAALGRWFFASSGIGDSSTPGSDPRGTLYTAGMANGTGGDDVGGRGFYFREAKYTNNCFWGGGAAKTTFGDSYDPCLWSSDPGHQTASAQFNTAPLETETPDIHLQNRAVASPPKPEKAPSHVKHPVDDYPVGYTGPGYYESLGELGFIFDPSAWTRVVGGAANLNFLGGGRTLRIGSPEIATLDTPGHRASDLLDILCLGERRLMKGIVNINSVRPEAARAIFAGMELKSERAVEGGAETSADGMRRNSGGTGAIFPPCGDTTTNAGSVFAAALTAPSAVVCASAAELSSLKTVNASGTPTTTPYFGDLAAWPLTPTAQSPRPEASGADPGLDDRGREEMFRRVLPLVSFHSRTFRMYLTAQVLDKQGNPVATRSKVYDVFLEPVRDSTGAIISQNIKVIYEKNL